LASFRRASLFLSSSPIPNAASGPCVASIFIRSSPKSLG
jgi:hypothetical protein